ncbi:MAG: hypothetical protein ACLS63_02670 [Flavonifractor plautii]
MAIALAIAARSPILMADFHRVHDPDRRAGAGLMRQMKPREPP